MESTISILITSQPFERLAHPLAVDAVRGDRPGFKPLYCDRLTAHFTNAECIVVDPFERIFDFPDELAFTVAHAQGKVAIDFEGCLIDGIG
jgi:hypothetical protein